jgi:hypothetical protein
MGIKYDALLAHYRRDPEAAGRQLRESFEKRDVKPRGEHC